MTLTCWHCGEEFEYTPQPFLADKPAAYFQGSTVCLNCVPCMPNKCNNPKHLDQGAKS